LERLKTAYQISEVTDNLIKGQEKDERIWDLLNETFKKLNTCHLSPNTYYLIYHYFLWNLLSILGYQIDPYNCVLCQKKLVPQKLYFNPEEGGIVCLDCLPSQILQSKTWEGKEISPDVIKILRIFLKRDWQTLLRLKTTELYKKSLESISESYLSYFKKGE